MTAYPPVIIMGMHRSGTTMISRMLADLGIFMGRLGRKNHEALFFHRCNQWLLRENGGSWAYPAVIDTLLDNPEARALVADYLRWLMDSPRSALYLGPDGYVQSHGLTRHMAPWGWKNPMNTYTLPLWLDIFPDAKVIYLYRHGVDVAQSLVKRTNQQLRHNLTRWQQIPGSLRYSLIFGTWPHYSTRCLNLAGAFDLWEEYTERGDHHMAALPAGQGLSVCYEDFLQNPVAGLQQICDFSGIQPGPARIQAVAAQVNESRSQAYAHNPELQAFYEQVKASPQMQRYGY